MDGKSLLLGYELTDYGKLLFEYDDGKSIMYVSKQKLKTLIRTPWFYICAFVVLFIISWFIASIVKSCSFNGEDRVFMIFLNLSGLIPIVFFAFFIKVMSKLLKGSGARNKNNEENSLRIYEDYIVITKGRDVKVYDLSQIKYISVTWRSDIVFASYQNEVVRFYIDIPQSVATVNNLDEIFVEKNIMATYSRSSIMSNIKSNDGSPMSLPATIGLTFFTLLPIGMGIGLIYMHNHKVVDVPIYLGAFFICFGALGVMGVYSFIPFVKEILVPFWFGCCFVVFPFWLVATISQQYGYAVNLQTFTTFSVYTCTAFIFALIGLLLIYTSFKVIAQYILYGHKIKRRK